MITHWSLSQLLSLTGVWLCCIWKRQKTFVLRRAKLFEVMHVGPLSSRLNLNKELSPVWLHPYSRLYKWPFQKCFIHVRWINLRGFRSEEGSLDQIRSRTHLHRRQLATPWKHLLGLLSEGGEVWDDQASLQSLEDQRDEACDAPGEGERGRGMERETHTGSLCWKMQPWGCPAQTSTDSRVEVVSVHGARGVLDLPQVNGALLESRVGLVQAGAPDGLSNTTQRSTAESQINGFSLKVIDLHLTIWL